MSNNCPKKVIFTCPECRRENKTTNANKRQKCHFCGEAVELELRRNGHGKNSAIEVLNVKVRREIKR